MSAARTMGALRWAVLAAVALSWACSSDSGPGGGNGGAGGATAGSGGSSGASGSSSGVGGTSGSGGSSGGLVGGSAGSAGMAASGGAAGASGTSGSAGMSGGGAGGSAGGGQGGGGSGGMGAMSGNAGSSGGGAGGGQGGGGSGGGGPLPETAHVFLGGSQGGTGVVALYTLTYATAELTLVKRVDVGQNGSFLAVDPGSALYVADDSGRRVRRLTLDAATWEPSIGNDQASSGAPVHIAVSSDGTLVLTAQYNEGSVEVFSVSGGMLGASLGSQNACAQAHQVVLSPQEDYLFVPCKGADRVERYTFNKTTGALSAPMSTATAGGAGPRHLAFAPNGAFAYLLNELSNNVYAYSYAGGTLTELQRITSLPDGFNGSSTGAEIWVSPSGSDVYASNRPQGQDGTIAQYRVGDDGRLTANGHQSTGGRTPRSFAIDPTGRVVIAGNLDSSSVGVMEVDSETGELGTPNVINVPFNPWYVGIFLAE